MRARISASPWSALAGISTHSQNMTTDASAQADMKMSAHLA